MTKSNLKEVTLFTTILWSWTWIGGWLLKDLLSSTLLGLFFILSPILMTTVFIILTRDEFKDIGLTKQFGQTRKLFFLSIEYFLWISLFVFIGSLILFDSNINYSELLPLLTMIIPVFVIIFIQAFFEEIAWAGWYYDKLTNFKFVPKVLIITIIWTIWHLPFFFWTEQLISINKFDLLLLGLIFAHLLVSRYLYSWYRMVSDNTFWSTLIHGLANTSGFIVGFILGNPPEGRGYLVIMLVLLANLFYLLRLFMTEERVWIN